MEVRMPNEGSQGLPPIKPGPWMIPVMILILISTAAGTLFYQVGPDELGVVQRFGKYVRTTEPGLRFKLPFGIESVKNIKVTHVFKEEFGFRTVGSGGRSLYADKQMPQQGTLRQVSGRANRPAYADPFLEESLMLTGDLNVAVVEWIVQYTVKDPVQFAFRVRDPRSTIRNMSEAVMRLVVGDHSINQVLTSGREALALEAQVKLQQVLDDYQAGVAIRNVILQDVTPPDEVKPSFNYVNEARQEKEKVINQAWEEYNRVIPKAKGQAEQLIREAEGYALERINHAQGDAERFTLTLTEYQKAPEVTKQRLYLEMAEKLYPVLEEKLVIDEAQQGIVPFLNLNRDKQEGTVPA